MRIRRTAWVGGLSLALLAVAGCSGDGMTTVSGTIKHNGKLVESGAINFTPADGKGPVTGGAIKDGAYSARVPPGLMKVSISEAVVVGKKPIYPTKNSPEMPITKEGLPEKYNVKTELTLDVKGGTLEKNWDLETKESKLTK
jgi:hypothetical protein